VNCGRTWRQEEENDNLQLSAAATYLTRLLPAIAEHRLSSLLSTSNSPGCAEIKRILPPSQRQLYRAR
jgi:hypothetical protein